MLQESFADVIVLWKTALESESSRAALQRSKAAVLFVDDLIVYSNSGASYGRLHFSKAYWNSISDGDGFEELVGRDDAMLHLPRLHFIVIPQLRNTLEYAEASPHRPCAA